MSETASLVMELEEQTLGGLDWDRVRGSLPPGVLHMVPVLTWVGVPWGCASAEASGLCALALDSLHGIP